MQLRKSERKKAKIKMAIQGASGSGKTYSSILLAKGLSTDMSKVAVIDTEHGSSDLYAHLGDYNVLNLETPFTPKKYIQAIDLCVNEGMEVVIIDSSSHCWEYLLQYHASLNGNSFANWSKVTPLQQAFVNKILQSPVHIIATMRTKQDYVLNLKNGKHVPEKVGLKAVQRNDVEYEYTIVFDINSNHLCKATKDRTNVFTDRPEFKITPDTGREILKWCNSGVNEEQVKQRIAKCISMRELIELHKLYPQYHQSLSNHFTNKKVQLGQLANPKNFSSNGASTRSN